MTTAQRLAGQVVVVTGSASGIGRATATALAAHEARVVAVDRHEHALDGMALVLAVDVRDEAQVGTMARTVVERYERIDALVHCAGVLRGVGGTPRPVVDTPTSEWDVVVDTNLKGTFLVNRAVLPAMLKQRRGQIVNLSSTSGRQGRAFDAVYCASKFGVVGLTQSIAEEVRAQGVKVYVLMPDAVDTPLWQQNGPIRPDVALAPERVADLICYMLALPDDTVLDNLVIAPFRGRRRRAAAREG